MSINLINQTQCPISQVANHLLCIRKTACILHVIHSVQLDLVILGLLLEDTDKLMVPWIRANAMDNRERELALRQVLAKPLVFGICRIGEIQEIVTDLKNQPHHIHQTHAVARRLALRLHQFDREPEEPACLVAHHFQVLVLAGTGEGFAPEEVHALAAVEVEEFLDVDVDRGGVVEFLGFLEGEEVDVVGGVDGLRSAEDIVRDGDSSSENGVVFDVVDSAHIFS